MTTSVDAGIGTCWVCGKDGGRKRRRKDGKQWRELICDSCRDDMKRNGWDFEDSVTEKRIAELEAEIARLKDRQTRMTLVQPLIKKKSDAYKNKG